MTNIHAFLFFISGVLLFIQATNSVSAEVIKTEVSSPARWANHQIVEGNYVNAGNWLGWLALVGDHVFNYRLGQWLLLPEANIQDKGAWGFLYRPLNEMKQEWNSALLQPSPNGWDYKTIQAGDRSWNLGDFDFSYAGYRNSNAPSGIEISISRLETLEASEGSDITQLLQNKINEMGKTGGIIQLPTGHFSISSNITVQNGNILIKGAGKDSTILEITDDFSGSGYSDYENSAIQFKGNWSWHTQEGFVAEVLDVVPLGSNRVSISSDQIDHFKVGEFIVIQQNFWPVFVETWSDSKWSTQSGSDSFSYYREIVAIRNNELIIDAPIGYRLDPANNPIRIYHPNGQLHNVGIEDLTIIVADNLNNNGRPFGSAIGFFGCVDVWMKNIKIENIARIGTLITRSVRVTFDNVEVIGAQDTGEGGYGYGFHVAGQSALYLNCLASELRHGWVMFNAYTNNIVLSGCTSRNHRPVRGNPVDDTHARFVHAILFDNHHQESASIFGTYRHTTSGNARQSLGWGIFWNIFNDGRDPRGNGGGIIGLRPATHAVVIGAHGGVRVMDYYTENPRNQGTMVTTEAIQTLNGPNTSNGKVLYEGTGRPGLKPQSLYKAQLSLRQEN